MSETYDGDGPWDLTVLLPAYNEADSIGPVIREIRSALADWNGTWEILVVDDASADATAERASDERVRVVRRPENGGYGSSLKLGIRHAHGRIIATLDADGTYVPSYLPHMLSFFPDYDQVNGARKSEMGTLRFIRSAAKLMIRKLAEWITRKRIPDLNTGLKVFKRDVMLRYLWCLPQGFSCSTSMTLAFLSNGHPVKYVPVEYRKRLAGTSSFHPIKDAARYGTTVVRIVMYFRPLRVFLPLALGVVGLLIARIATRTWRLGRFDFADADVILAVAAFLVLIIGLLADLIVAQRRDVSATIEEVRVSLPNAKA